MIVENQCVLQRPGNCCFLLIDSVSYSRSTHLARFPNRACQLSRARREPAPYVARRVARDVGARVDWGFAESLICQCAI